MKANINKPDLWQHILPKPKADIHKYDKGHVLVYGSPYEGSGATKLVALSALRTGAGLVSVVSCNEDNLRFYAGCFTSIMAKYAPDEDRLTRLIKERKVNVAVVGSGNGVGERTRKTALCLVKQQGLSCVLDADIFTSFAENPHKLTTYLHKDCVLTPHEGEFHRLFPHIKGERPTRAVKAAKEAGCVLVLKGHHTIIASYEGDYVVNKGASHRLATAGTGDVLAGIIAGLMAQNMPPFFAASAGVYLHSLCAKQLGAGMIAEDMPHNIPQARQTLQTDF